MTIANEERPKHVVNIYELGVNFLVEGTVDEALNLLCTILDITSSLLTCSYTISCPPGFNNAYSRRSVSPGSGTEHKT